MNCDFETFERLPGGQVRYRCRACGTITRPTRSRLVVARCERERPNQRGDAELADVLAICQACQHYSARRVAPGFPGDGYCSLLTCRAGANGLVAYARDRARCCPRRKWRQPKPEG